MGLLQVLQLRVRVDREVIPQSSRIGASPSDVLAPYLGHSLRESYFSTDIVGRKF